MFIALACVHGARWLSAYEPDARQLALMRLGGHVLAGLAFAMALARPPDPSCYSAATRWQRPCSVCSCLEARLRAERLPAYIYLIFVALFLGYFGAYYFVRDLLLPIEGPARRRSVGRWLPGPYRAINGLVLNLFLGFWPCCCVGGRMSGWPAIATIWALPFSVAACATAASSRSRGDLPLSYTLLYLLATRVFASPRVQYLAIARCPRPLTSVQPSCRQSPSASRRWAPR